MRFRAVDPSNGKTIRELEGWSRQELFARLQAACEAQRNWRARPIAERCKRLIELADALQRQKRALAEAMTEEMGKPIRQAQAEVEKSIRCCHAIAERAPQWLAPREENTPSGKAIVRYAPLGVILGVMPWNFPLWQVVRFAVPTLTAGNGCVIKHAPSTPGCARLIDEIFFGVFGDLARIGLFDEALVAEAIASDFVAGASLTGSPRAGRAIGQAAGKALKPCVLELGGSDPYIVLADADLDPAVETCVAARMINSGQTCIAAKRWIVEAPVYEAFAEKVVAAMQRLKVGDPRREDVEIGPLARRDLLQRLKEQVQESLAQGARILWQAELPAECAGGFYYPPTVLADVRPGMPAFDEELFGPVAALIRAEDEEEAIALANRSRYGLGAGVFSSDSKRAQRVAERIEAGGVAINRFLVSEPLLPFGGIKQSGFGRELGPEGVRAFTNLQTILL